jgi:hypothetical protein
MPLRFYPLVKTKGPCGQVWFGAFFKIAPYLTSKLRRALWLIPSGSDSNNPNALPPREQGEGKPCLRPTLTLTMPDQTLKTKRLGEAAPSKEPDLLPLTRG